jgi:hypothetical protein
MLQGLIIFLGIALITFKLLNKVTQSSKFPILGELINHVDAKEKVVALTYDDGPNPPYTNQVDTAVVLMLTDICCCCVSECLICNLRSCSIWVIARLQRD